MINMANNKGKTNKKTKTKIKKKRKNKIGFFLILIIIIFIGAYLVTSPSFDINEISVKGNDQFSKQKIEELAEIKIGDNIFTKIGIITKVKLKQSGYIEDAKIIKKYPNKIEIELIERKKQFQIKTETGIFINIDEQGYIIDSSADKLEIPTIIGMEIKENDSNVLKRLEEKDLNKMENVLQIREQFKMLDIVEKVTQIQVDDEYIVSLENDGLIINLGDATNLKNRMYYVSAILKKETGNKGTIYVNGNLNENFTPYFSANV